MKSYSGTGTVDGNKTTVTAEMVERGGEHVVSVVVQSDVTHHTYRHTFGRATSMQAAEQLFGIACATVDDIVKGDE